MYDFAGRLTFNQFGLDGTTSKRIYEQTISYDGFSQMTTRNTIHWETYTNTGGTYVNGRKTSGIAPTYDAAGNITYQQQSEYSSQWSTYDAAGRRIAVRDRWRLAAAASQENETGYEHDGDGRPVIEKVGFRVITTPYPDPMVVNKVKYQVWSSVLGSSLTTVEPDGDKLETKVFAGGTHVATQYGSASQGAVNFHTADPVTGTVGSFGSGGTATAKDEIEPLGQKIDVTDPGTSYPTTYADVNGTAKDPEWQCLKWEKFRAGDFRSMPIHCQKKVATDPKWFTEYFGNTDAEESPKKVALVDSRIPRFSLPGGGGADSGLAYAANAIRHQALISTSKSDDEDDEPIRIHTRERGWEIPGFVDASTGFFDDDLEKIYNTPACKVAAYDQLSDLQKRLYTVTDYNNLTDLQRAVFVNITGALIKAGANLEGLKVSSVEKDRLLFAKGSTDAFRKSIEAGTKSKPKTFEKSGWLERTYNKVVDSHDGMNSYMARQNVALNSLQVGFGDKGAFADIDLWNPNFPNDRHDEEVDYNRGPPKRVTPHFYLAKVLGNCK